jgi:hypothetical protein
MRTLSCLECGDTTTRWSTSLGRFAQSQTVMHAVRTTFRSLRIIVSVVFGVACVLTIWLWMRSYRQYDTLYWPSPHRVTSIAGWIRVDEDFKVTGRFPKSMHRIGNVRILSVSGDVTPAGAGLPIPHGLIVALVAGLAILPWMRWYYSLRTLLAITTLIAAGLGLHAVLKR